MSGTEPGQHPPEYRGDFRSSWDGSLVEDLRSPQCEWQQDQLEWRVPSSMYHVLRRRQPADEAGDLG